MIEFNTPRYKKFYSKANFGSCLADIALCRSRRRERKRGLNCVFKEQTVFRQYSALGMDCTLGGPNYLL